MVFSKKKEPSNLELELEEAINDLRNAKVETEDERKLYEEKLKRVERLTNLIGKKEKKGVIPWIPVICAGISFTEIIAIIHHEQVGVITTKAMSRVFRGRV